MDVKRRGDLPPSLNRAIANLIAAEMLSNTTPVKDVFGTVRAILTTIRVVSFYFAKIHHRLIERTQDSIIDEKDYFNLGLACNTVCTALDLGLRGKRVGELNGPVLNAMSQLTT